MLNKELLQYTRNSGRISVRFLKDSPMAKNIAGVLLDIYREAAVRKLTRSELEENLEPFLKAAVQGKTVAGMNKVILDHCGFTSQSCSANITQWREELFKTAAQVLSEKDYDIAEYRKRVISLLPEKSVFNDDIYGDLPEFDRLTAIQERNVD